MFNVSLNYRMFTKDKLLKKKIHKKHMLLFSGTQVAKLLHFGGKEDILNIQKGQLGKQFGHCE